MSARCAPGDAADAACGTKLEIDTANLLSNNNNGQPIKSAAREKQKKEFGEKAEPTTTLATILTLTTTTTTRPPTRHLTTFKGTTNNSNKSDDNNNNTWKRQNHMSTHAGPPIAGNSLESINSRYSISSANDDSQQQQLQLQLQQLATMVPQNTNDQIELLASSDCNPNRQSICTAARQLASNTGSLYISPPSIDTAFKWPAQAGAKAQASEQASNLRDCKHFQEEPIVFDNNNNKNSGAGGRKLTSNQSEKQPPRDGLPISARKQQQQEEAENPVYSGPPFKFAGILASLTGSIFFSLSFLCIKLVPNASFEARAHALLIRGVSICAFCSVTIIIRKNGFLIKRNEIWVNTLRAIFGTLGVFFTYCAMKYISLGDSTALVFSSPIWTALLSRLILKEPLRWFYLFALPLSIFGIVLIAHPALIVGEEHLSILHHRSAMAAAATAAAASLSSGPSAANTTTSHQQIISNATTAMMTMMMATEQPAQAGDVNELPIVDEPDETGGGGNGDQRWLGVLISLCTSFLVSCSYIVLKFRKTTPVQTTTFWLGFALMTFALIFLCFTGLGELPTNYELSLYLANGFFSWCGQTVLQWAFLHEKAGILSIVRTMDVALTFSLSAIFLDDDIYWTSILGATIISLVVVSIMLNNWLAENWSWCTGAHNNGAAADTGSLPAASELALAYDHGVDDVMMQDNFAGQKSKSGAPKLKSICARNDSGAGSNPSSYCIGSLENGGSQTQRQIYRPSSKA